MGGIKTIPIFEDADFSRRLNKRGKLKFLKGPVVTCAHRYLKSGIGFHSVRNQILKILYAIGFNAHTLKDYYKTRT